MPVSNTPCTSGAHSTSTSSAGVDALLLQRDAVARVHEQALAAAELADDRVARDRPAALRVLDRDTFDAAQRERAELRVRRRRRLVGLAGHLGQRLRDDERQPLAEADVGEDLELALGAVFLRQRFPAVPRDRVRLDLERRQRLVEQALAERRRLLLLQSLQVVADARARLAGGDERQPRRIGTRGRRGQDLDVVAVLELGAQRQELVVDARRRRSDGRCRCARRRRSRPRSRRAAAP